MSWSLLVVKINGWIFAKNDNANDNALGVRINGLSISIIVEE